MPDLDAQVGDDDDIPRLENENEQDDTVLTGEPEGSQEANPNEEGAPATDDSQPQESAQEEEAKADTAKEEETPKEEAEGENAEEKDGEKKEAEVEKEAEKPEEPEAKKEAEATEDKAKEEEKVEEKPEEKPTEEKADEATTSEPAKEETKEEDPKEEKSNEEAPKNEEEEKPTENAEKQDAETKEPEEVKVEDDKKVTEQLEAEPEPDPEVTTGSEHSTEHSQQKEDHSNDPNWNNKYDLLDYVMSFLETDENLNDVLTGYFSKLVNSLAQKRTDLFLPYLYENETRMMNFCKHVYSRSLTEDLSTIMRQEVTFTETLTQEVVESMRQKVVRAIIENLKSEDESRLEEYCLNVPQLFQDWCISKAMYPHLSDSWVVEQLVGLAKQDNFRGVAALRILKTLLLHL